MLKLMLASIALVASWLWTRAEFSRAIRGEAPLRGTAVMIRAGTLLVAFIWFVAAVAGVFSRVVGWMLALAVLAAFAWFVREGLRMGKAELDRRKASTSESTPGDGEGDGDGDGDGDA